MGREAFLPLFFGDFLASTFAWSGEEQGLYLLLLGYQWVSGPLPNDPAKLARAVRYDHKRFVKLWDTVRGKFEETEAGLVNVRLEEHRAKSHEVSRRRAEAGAKGGRPAKQTESAGKAIAKAALKHPSHPIPSHVSPPSGEGASSDAAPPPADGVHPPSSDAKPARPKRRGPLGHFVPTDWEVPDADADWARAEFPLLDLYAATQKFREHEFAQPKSDWRLTWRRWIRTEAEMQARRAGNGRR